MSKSFWETMCGLLQFYRVVFYISVAVVSLIIITLLVVRRGTATYYISLLTIGINVPIAICSGYMIRKCVNQQQTDDGGVGYK